ncbi:MAG TPA: alpha/beta hydrolase [Pyrinomonadaceae bacterium]|nr:alpha/beta hydrolase [Pyrinomonadaceae bacterium]
MKEIIFAFFFAIQLLIVNIVAQAQPYQIINTQNSVVGGDLSKTVTTIQEGNNSLDRFLMTEVTKPLPNQAIRGVILLMPPLGSGFQNYEVGEDGDYNNSFVAFFARRNFAVFGYSPRVQGLAAGSCESGAVDCSPMANWGLQTVVDDATFIRQQIALKYPDLKIVVGGLSMGSIASQALLNAYPNDYAGAILIEGTLHDTSANVRAINANFCALFEAQLAGGVYYDGQSAPGFKFLNQLAQVAPNAPAAIPGFPPGITNHQAWVLALSAPPLSPLTPRPGYYNVAGNFLEDRFFFANEQLVHDNAAGFNDYTPVRAFRDLNCGLAGETTFTNNLSSFTGPVIMFAGGHGFGSAMLDTAQLMNSADVTINFKADYGHVDYMFSKKHQHELEHPIFNWLLQKPLR